MCLCVCVCVCVSVSDFISINIFAHFIPLECRPPRDRILANYRRIFKKVYCCDLFSSPFNLLDWSPDYDRLTQVYVINCRMNPMITTFYVKYYLECENLVIRENS